jgi:hypothetical protein
MKITQTEASYISTPSPKDLDVDEFNLINFRNTLTPTLRNFNVGYATNGSPGMVTLISVARNYECHSSKYIDVLFVVF